MALDTSRGIALTQAQLDAFGEDGFLVVPHVFGDDDLAAMRAAFDRLARTARTLPGTGLHDGAQFVIDRDDDGVRIHRVVWCGAAEPVLLDYGADPRLVSMASKLLGTREMDQLINQAHFKLPGDAVRFPWHQDSFHRRYGTDLWTDVNGRGSFVQAVTAVDPMRIDNGALYMIPGSHRRGHLAPPGPDEAIPEDWFDVDRAVPVVMDAGSVALFGPYVIHGSAPNTSDTPRRVFINGYAVPGANRRVYPGEGAGRRLRWAG